MSSTQCPAQDFGSWNGEPLWKDVPRRGRVAQVLYPTDETFVATGCHEPSGSVVFSVHGSVGTDFDLFAAQMAMEGAALAIVQPPSTMADALDRLPGLRSI